MSLEVVYKLTDGNNKTRPGKYNETLWGEGVNHTAPGTNDMCGPGWIHAYPDPILAVMLNPAHADYGADMLMWECVAEVGIRKPDKIGCTSLTTVKKVSIPSISNTQRQAFAILAAKQVFKDSDFQKWADAWLTSKDRSAEATRAADLDLVSIAREAMQY